MRLHVATQPSGLQQLTLSSWAAVVIDVVRATTTIAQAIASGCRRVIPVATIEEAKEEAQAWRRAHPGEEALLCGERHGPKIPGFDLGNSPLEYTPEAVQGRTLVFTTTNGTLAIRASRGAGTCIIGAFVNLPAVTRYLEQQDRDVVFVPAGREGRPVLDDVVCAGMFVDRLLAAGKAEATDEALLARMAYLGYRGRVLDALLDSPSGQTLVAVGLSDDLPACAAIGSLDMVPFYIDGVIPAAHGT